MNQNLAARGIDQITFCRHDLGFDQGDRLGDTPKLVALLRPFPPRRIVCLSTIGVYGAAERVDAQTAPPPDTEQHNRRIETETALADGPWSAMVLRPAEIYGPGRGVHWSARRNPFRPPSAQSMVSRIHVDDLAEPRRGRTVDGSAVRALLGLTLRYPSYREGVPARLEAENAHPGESGRHRPPSAPD